MKTFQLKSKDIVRNWHLVDAKGQVLGRMSAQIAIYLMGKHKREYAPQADFGDYVVVVNSLEVRVTGGKEKKKVYYRHSGYPGGLKTISYARMQETRPGEVVRLAVAGMLPTNRLKAKRLARLFVFPGGEHPYESRFKKDGKN